LDKPENQAQLAPFQSVFNLDPRTQLHGLTWYSTSGVPEDGVLLVYADLDSDRLKTLAQRATDYQSTRHNQHVIHNWIGDPKKARRTASSRVYASIEEKRVIFGLDESSVASALDVLDGASPNLSASKTYAGLGAGSNHTFLEAAARKVELQDSGPQSALLRLAKRLHLEAGEVEQQASVLLKVETTGEEVARQITAVSQGLLALVKLQSEKPEAVKLAESISLKPDGPTVVAKLAMSATKAIELYKADAARKARKRAAAKRAQAKQ
jgi:hypothetical protein